MEGGEEQQGAGSKKEGDALLQRTQGDPELAEAPLLSQQREQRGHFSSPCANNHLLQQLRCCQCQTRVVYDWQDFVLLNTLQCRSLLLPSPGGLQMSSGPAHTNLGATDSE